MCQTRSRTIRARPGSRHGHSKANWLLWRVCSGFGLISTVQLQQKSFLLQVGWTLAAWVFWVSLLQVKVYSLKSNNYTPLEISLNVIISAKTFCAQIPTQLLGHRVPKTKLILLTHICQNSLLSRKNNQIHVSLSKVFLCRDFFEIKIFTKSQKYWRGEPNTHYHLKTKTPMYFNWENTSKFIEILANSQNDWNMKFQNEK